MSREGRTGRRVLAAAATAAAALAAFVAPGAAGSSKPHARLSVSDPTPTVGQEVVFDSSRSRGDIEYHLWDLDGDREYETSTRARARVSHVFKRAGKVRVTVAVFDGDGGHSVRRATLRVAARPAPRSAPAAKHSKDTHVRAATTKAKKKAADAVDRVAKAQSSSGDESPQVQKAASTQSVTISDFKYNPESITVSVGTTVTWTNDGPTAHTATADDGTFDTGNLVKGASRSYKFTKAGTFKYHCTPHPFMKATVTVSSSGGSSAPDDSNSNSNDNGSGSGSGGDSDHDSSLPHTGLRIASFLLAGLLLLGGGTALRRRLARP